MWVLTRNGEKAVNLDRCDKLTMMQLEGQVDVWQVTAWYEEEGQYIFEGTLEQGKEYINSITARMNGKIL